MNTIKNLEKDKICVEDKALREKKKVKILYVEADEDHVSLQNESGVALAKMVYVHEGLEKLSPKRNRLKNIKYFGGVYKHSEDLWEEVADYIYERYDWDYIEKIYLAGDGAGWIRKGTGWLKNCRFVLDKYHLEKYIKKATGHIKNDNELLVRALRIALYKGDYEKFSEVFRKIYKVTENEKKLKKTKDVRRYMAKNWDGIEIYKKEKADVIGCSAEGHVSHLLADRLSSRPMGWSRDRADKVTRLRVFKRNGGDIFDLVMANKRQEKQKAVTQKYANKILGRAVMKKYDTDYSNTVVLDKGRRTGLYKILKTMRGIV